MSICVIIDATTIREGGGYVLLCGIVDNLVRMGCSYKIYGNSHLCENADFDVKLTSWKDLFDLYVLGVNNCLYFCNRSPIFGGNKSVVYIHSEYSTYSIKEILIQDIKKSRKLAHLANFVLNWLSKRFGKTTFVVQTKSMREKLKKRGISSEILPVFDSSVIESECYKKVWDFCYVSYPWPHKNHRMLLDALNNNIVGNGFTLVLTIPEDDRFRDLIDMIKEINARAHYEIINIGSANKDAVHKIYSSSKALLFLSTKESFGLPLIEATQYELPIIAQNLHYVNDIVNKVHYIDASSPLQMVTKLDDFSKSKLNSSSLKISDKTEELIEMLI